MMTRNLALVVAACCACGSPLPPKDLDCKEVVSAGGGAGSLTRALENAGSGDCVLLNSETYRGDFSVPPGVTLSVADGEDGRIVGASADRPAVTLGEAAVLWGVRISSAEGIAVLVDAAIAHIVRVEVAHAKVAGIVVTCTGTSCLESSNEIEMRDTDVTESELGVWVGGARLRMENGSVNQQSTTHLAGGYGVVATAGAHLAMHGTVVADNHSVGVLIDGSATLADLDNVEVRGNQGRGVWVQRLVASIASPGVTVSGGSLITGNRIAGLGVVASTGVVVTDTEISGTVLAPAVTDDTMLAEVGDGLGVFKLSGDIQLDGVTLSANQRAQLLIDEGGTGIDVVDITVTATGSQEGAVMQNTINAISDPMGTVSQIPVPIEVSAPEIPIPQVSP